MSLINLPASFTERGIGAFAFANGLGELAHLTSSAVKPVELWRIPIVGAPANMVSEIPLLSRALLREKLGDPQRVVLLCEEAPITVRVLTLADMDRLTAG